MAVTFVTGPVRSGKSRFAERLARESALPVTYVATAAIDPSDAEWKSRIERHQRERSAEWRTFESATLPPAELCDYLAGVDDGVTLLVDALGTWLAARIGANIERVERDYDGFESELDMQSRELADALLATRATAIVVCEQVGWDVVPPIPSARLFRDVLGRLAQRIATRADRAFLVVAGIALDLRAQGEIV